MFGPADASENCRRTDIGILCQFFDVFTNLDGQFTCRYQDQRTGIAHVLPDGMRLLTAEAHRIIGGSLTGKRRLVNIGGGLPER